MAEQAWLTNLGDAQALSLAQAALDLGESAARIGWCLLDQGSLGLKVSLGLPTETAQALVDQEAARHENLDLQWEQPGGESFAFEPGLLALLRPRPGEAGEWQAEEDECLLLMEGASLEAAGVALEELSFAATQTRIAASAVGGQNLWLFHLKDDPIRKSTLQGILQSGRIGPLTRLHAYRADGRTIFFPEGARPGRPRFEAVCRLWARAGRRIEGTGPLFAAHPGPAGSGTWRCLWLADLRFIDQTHFQPAPSELPRVELLPLVDASSQVEQLQLRFSRGEATSGYALKLEPVQEMIQTGNAERMRLREQLADIEQRLAYLRSLDRATPVLYRIPQSQLERLARLLSAFPVDALHSGELQYAFASDPLEPGGCHFIWINADSAFLSNFEPMERASAIPLRHVPDPLWASSYYSEERRSQVFVPEGLQLFPNLHAWDPSLMDQYLADCVRAWQIASGEATPPPQPRRSLYLFREHPSEPQHLHVQVLDRDRFAPLHTRLGWINDNLLVTRDQGLEAFIQSLADATTRLDMLQRKEMDAGEAADRLGNITNQVDEITLARIRSTLHMLSDRIEHTVRLVAESRTELHALERSFNQLKSARSKLVKANRKNLRKLEIDLAELPVHLRRSRETMDQLLGRANAERELMDRNMLRAAEDLAEKRAKLVETLKRQLRLKRKSK